MTAIDPAKEVPKGSEWLRRAANLFDNGPTEFNREFSARELLRLYRCYFHAAYDIPPWKWSERQLREALKHKRVPMWNNYEKPVYQKGK